ncbi:hypothetical protein TNCV_3229181 [Trichonephila clavipes]|nr:hypothetical protein TNCV_3229181 [Trichonephila clavipes]
MIANTIAKSPKWSPLPTWSPKLMPTRLYRQDFAKFPSNHHYNGSNLASLAAQRDTGSGSNYLNLYTTY